jgi:hypothetical protein
MYVITLQSRTFKNKKKKFNAFNLNMARDRPMVQSFWISNIVFYALSSQIV